MQLFLADQINPTQAVLGNDESHHLCKVLRKDFGDTIFITDGKGKSAKAKISLAHPKQCLLEVLELQEHAQELDITLAVAFPKSRDRVEWLVEKAIELGCTHIQPIICKNSERSKLNTERLQKIALSAMKQSAQFFLPNIAEALPYSKWMQHEHEQIQKWIAYCPTGLEQNLMQQDIKPGKQVILIGPEGDFSKEEVDLALEKGYQNISLGKFRLRTETAALAAINILSQKLSAHENNQGSPHFSQH